MNNICSSWYVDKTAAVRTIKNTIQSTLNIIAQTLKKCGLHKHFIWRKLIWNGKKKGFPFKLNTGNYN